MNCTATDMVQDYINGIADIDTRINDLQKEVKKKKSDPTIRHALSQRIKTLSDMRSDMVFALYRLQEYGGVK